MVAAELAMVDFFKQHLAVNSETDKPFNYHFWQPFRYQALLDNPELAHDVTSLRFVTYREGIFATTGDKQLAQTLATHALDHFLTQRSNFEVAESSHIFLQTLADKLPLVAISNGNVDLNAIGLSPYFTHVYLAGDGRMKKPHQDMFDQAANALSLMPGDILHVGDCGHADIVGAHNAGLQTAWLNRYDVGQPLRVLPHIELTRVEQLLTLV